MTGGVRPAGPLFSNCFGLPAVKNISLLYCCQYSGWRCVFVQLLSHVQRFFANPWTAAHQASLSFTVPWNLLKLMSTELVMPSNRLVLCRPLLLLTSVFPSSGSFPMSRLFTSGDQSIGASTSASALPVNIQEWFPLGLTEQYTAFDRDTQHGHLNTSLLGQWGLCTSTGASVHASSTDIGLTEWICSEVTVSSSSLLGGYSVEQLEFEKFIL